MTLEGGVLPYAYVVTQGATVLDSMDQACQEFGISRVLFYR